MDVRSRLALAVAAFLIVGVVAWVLGMPRPAASGGGAGGVAIVTTSDDEATDAGAAAQASGAPGGAGQAGAGAASTAAGAASAGGAASPSGGATIDPGWLQATAGATGIPPRALQAYASGAVREQADDASCGIAWNTLAAIGAIESAHGTTGGASIGPDGHLVGTILGPRLDGGAYPVVRDSDGGTLDGDSAYDRAVGPLQFLPSTWRAHGVDGSGDGAADPNQIDDAALTAARYLCAAGGDLTTADGWQRAIAAYNSADGYADRVRDQADAYAQEATG